MMTKTSLGTILEIITQITAALQLAAMDGTTALEKALSVGGCDGGFGCGDDDGQACAQSQDCHHERHGGIDEGQVC